MPKPPTHAGTQLLAAGFLTALLVWCCSATAMPLAHALAVAGVQEDDEEAADDYEEEAEAEEQEEEADADEPAEIEDEDENDTSSDMEAEEEDDSVDETAAQAAEEEEGTEDPADPGNDADTQASAEDSAVEDEDEVTGSDDADDAQTSADDDETDEEMPPGDDYADDAWAGAWAIDEDDEGDDVIAVDHARFGDDEVWQVIEEDDDGGRGEEDSVDSGMATIRTTRSAAGKAGGKPPRQPGDDDDTVYSYGGLPVAAMSVPWQAQILYPGAPPKANDKRPAWQRQHYCGGSLIAPDWVLTAAHCIDQQEVDLGFKVRLGAQDISRGDGVTYRIDRIVRHSQYNAASNDVAHPPNMYANDIALIHIVPDGKPVPTDSRRIRQIPLNDKPLQRAVPVSATGWGVTGSSESANTMNAVLLRVDLQAMPNTDCQQRPGYGPQKIKEGVFCAAHPRKSTCRGDSGGPVILTNGTPLLVGIVSWGKKACAGDGRPAVYTRVDHYAQWIKEAMKLPPGKNSLP